MSGKKSVNKSKVAAKKPVGKAAKKPAKPKTAKAYVVVREVPAENKCYTDPTTVFATKAAATAHAVALNVELRAVCNPFERYSPEFAVKGSEKTLLALLAEVGAPAPTKPTGYQYHDWEGWWDAAYFDMTDAQRDAVWDALTKFPWFEVQAVTVE